MRFEKWQALGNDYAVVEEPELPFELTPARVRRLCAAHTGLGSDGLLVLSEAPEPELVARLRIFNPDGSEAELSGNGARQAILYLRLRGWIAEDDFAIATAAGAVRARITGRDSCRVALTRARLSSDDYPTAQTTAGEP
jgi:diaminopimelate epimerase